MLSSDDEVAVDGVGVKWGLDGWCERPGTPRGERYWSGQLTGPLQGTASYCTILHNIARYCTILQEITQNCNIAQYWCGQLTGPSRGTTPLYCSTALMNFDAFPGVWLVAKPKTRVVPVLTSKELTWTICSLCLGKVIITIGWVGIIGA